MPQETAQPFNKTPRSPDDPELVAKVLGTQEADDMRALTGEQPAEEEPTTPNLDDVEIATSITEQAAAEDAESNPRQEERNRLIEWAKLFDKDESWIDQTFEINIDGSVAAKFDLDLSHTQAPHMRVLRGAVIRGNLWLLNCTVLSIPRDLKVNGEIFVKPHQHQLMRDMDRKGFKYNAIEE